MDEINVRIEPVDEIIASVLQDDDIEVSIEEAEEIEVQAFDYPPEIDQLNSRVAACEENSQNAVGLANTALETATESAVLAATANETANNAGTLASQAAQAAQQAEGIAEGAATTAGEAVQSINEHASSTTNPHPTNVTQEFADTQITQLAVEATYTPTVWTYLVGLFTTVPKSVKEHIVKGWTVIENLKSRISFLENNLILSIALTETVASLDINLPTSEYDIELEVDYTCATDGAAQASLRINDVSTSNYVAANSQTYSGFVSYVGRHASKGVYRFVLINGFVFYFCDIQQIWGNISTQTVVNRSITGFLKVPQIGINKITFAHPVNEGSKFIIRRIKRHA